ncbi:hypothetical protein JCM11641_004294 [Rhodosporidiobolus odoratus]
MSWHRNPSVNDNWLNDVDHAAARQHIRNANKHAGRAQKEMWEVGHNVDYAARHEWNVVSRTARDGLQAFEGGGAGSGSAAPLSTGMRELGREAHQLYESTRQSPLVLKSQQLAAQAERQGGSGTSSWLTPGVKSFGEVAGAAAAGVALTATVDGLYGMLTHHGDDAAGRGQGTAQGVAARRKKSHGGLEHAAAVAGIVAADVGLLGAGVELGRRRERARSRSGTGMYETAR